MSAKDLHALRQMEVRPAWWILWIGLTLAPYTFLVWALWRPFGGFGLAVLLTPTVPWGYILYHLLPTRRKELGWAGPAKVLLLGTGLYLLTCVAFFSLRSPAQALSWPLEAILLVIGDPSSPPRFDYESRSALRPIVMHGGFADHDPQRAESKLSSILEEHPEYYNVYSLRAVVRWRQGQVEAAVDDVLRGREVYQSGGLHLGYDSDSADDFPPDAMQRSYYELLEHMSEAGRL